MKMEQSAEGSLTPQLRDFASSRMFGGVPELDQSRRIEISYETLRRYLNDAERRYQLRKEENGIRPKLPLRREKRKREESPTMRAFKPRRPRSHRGSLG